MERVLVTGGSGFLGRYVVEAAVDDYEVLSTCFRNDATHRVGDSIRVDLTNPPFPLLKAFDPDHVIHCAALTDVDECEQNPEHAQCLNVSMSEHVAKFAAEADARLMYMSTDAVFDGTSGRWSEDDSPNPINEYSRTKYEGERRITRIVDDAVIVRTNFFGWTRGDGSSLAEWMLDVLTSGEVLTGFEDVFFTPLYAGDLAGYLIELLQRDVSGRIHLGSRDRLSKYAFGHEVAEVFGFKDERITPIEVSELDLPAPRGKDLSLDVSYAESVLDRSMPTVRAGLERMKREREP